MSFPSREVEPPARIAPFKLLAFPGNDCLYMQCSCLALEVCLQMYLFSSSDYVDSVFGTIACSFWVKSLKMVIKIEDQQDIFFSV